MAIKLNTPDTIEIVNDVLVGKDEDIPTMLAEFGTWRTDDGNHTGIVVDVFGHRAPILGATEARRLSKWLLHAAERMDGSRADGRRGQKKRRHDEDDE